MAVSRVLKVSKNGKVFLSRVVRNGPIQQWFKANIGDKAGACVSKLSLNKHGHTGAVQHAIAKYCTPSKGEVTVPANLRRPAKAMNPAAMPASSKGGF
jgi:hypothetical protein